MYDNTLFCVNVTCSMALRCVHKWQMIENAGVYTSVKPLSQLAHDHFKTLCDPAFWQSHDGSPTLHELSLPLHAIFRSPAVASDF